MKKLSNISFIVNYNGRLACLTKTNHSPEKDLLFIKDDSLVLGGQNMIVGGGYIFIQHGVFKDIFIYHQEELVKTKGEGLNLYHPKFFKNNLVVGSKITKSFHKIDVNTLEEEDLGYYIRSEYVYKEKFYNHRGVDQVSCYSYENKLLWKTDITQYGEWKKLDGTIAKNIREYDPFPCGDFIMVPMKGGQLLALDAITGDHRWTWSDMGMGGKYGCDNFFVYNIRGHILYKIDLKSGRPLLQVNVQESTGDTDFYVTSPVWVRSNYIILNKINTGKVAVFDKETLELFKYFEFDGKIAHSERKVEVINQTLYILDMEYNLRIIELIDK